MACVADVQMQPLFDDKLPTTPGYQYKGAAGAHGWKRKVTGYWLSKCPALKNALAWVEKCDTQIPNRFSEFVLRKTNKIETLRN